MKQIRTSKNEHSFPRNPVNTVECRKRDLVIRIADWSRQSLQSGEPAWDVEVIIGGVYDWNESQTFTLREYRTKIAAKLAAIEFAGKQIRKLL